MTDGRFKELVNLYLDREISPRDFQQLRQELAKADRKRQFESLRRVHLVEKQAFQLLCDQPSDESRRNTLAARATKAINDARLRFEERRKGMVLMGQFTAATAAIVVTVSIVYHESIEALEVEAGSDTELAAANQIIRDRYLAQITNPANQGNARLIMDESGRALALVSYQDEGEVQVQSLQSVPEANIFRLGQALEAARPQLPDPSELLEDRSPVIPARQLPGTAAPIVLVEENTSPGAIVGYAY